MVLGQTDKQVEPVNPYQAPLDEIRFTLRELSGLEELAKLSGAESLADPELTDAILGQAAHFAAEVLDPLDSVGDHIGARWSSEGVVTAPGFTAAYRQFVEAGWNNISIPGEYGGQGLPNLLCAAVQEIFTAANKAFTYWPELTTFGVKGLAAAASEPLKSLYIPKLASGQWSATMNLTEPQAGSDVGAANTRAEPQADGTYRIFGQKIFITCGEHDLTENIVHLVLARTIGAPQGSRGLSLFLVPKYLPTEAGIGTRNDVECTGIERKLGNHASPTCTMMYGGRGAGAVGWLVGAENKGLQGIFVMVNSARFSVGVEALAMSERSYQQALAYARERIQGKPANGGAASVPIIRHPDVRRMLMMMRCQTEAIRGVAYAIAGARDQAAGHPDPAVRRERQAFVDLMIPVFKGWASETAISVTSTSVQVHGGIGYMDESGASQPFRDVRVTAIYEGTTSIQAHDLVERKLVRDGGTALRSWLSQINETLVELAASDNEALRQIESRLRPGVQSLGRAAEWAIDHYSKQPLEVLSGSVPLLLQFGVVSGGWQMARAALAAVSRLKQGRGKAAFLQAKLNSAGFYATHVLPQLSALEEVVIHGGQSVMAMDEASF
jgi:3-(methylthio)propanoyl-CoA dehydrogenase